MAEISRNPAQSAAGTTATPAKVIRVGSVGIGGVSMGGHLPGIDRSPDLKLAAVCDIDPERLKLARQRYGIDEAHCFSDYHDLINCPDVDAVDISTPNVSHFLIASAAAEAGKPYCLEKPITMDTREATELARRTGSLPHMVCFSYRFKSAARFARDLVRSGAIGRVYHADMQYFQAGSLVHLDNPLRWRSVKSIAGSGALGDLGSHALDLVRFVTGHEYTKVTGHLGTYVTRRRLPDGSGDGTVDVDDFSNYLAEMDDGASCSFQISRMTYGRNNYQRLELYGENGAILYHLNRDAAAPTPDGDEIEVCIGAAFEATHSYTLLPVPAKYKSDQMQSFADILNGRGDGLAATISDGLINMRALDAVLKSSETGAWVKV